MEFALGKPHVPGGLGEAAKTLGSALFKVLEGISKSWDLDQTELAAILHRDPSTLSTWKKSKSVTVSKDRPAPNDVQIYELIEFFDSLSSMLFRKEDQTKWLRTPSIEFGKKSPLALLKENPKNLFVLREYVDRVARP
jgi:hypothetical protein